MKVKLLKKIRRRYKITYYPEGRVHHAYGIIVDKGLYIVSIGFLNTEEPNGFNCLKEAKDWIMKVVRRDYEKYSVKYKKPNYKGIKVWYNK